MHSPNLNRVLAIVLLCALLPSLATAKGLGLSPHRAQFAAPSFEQAPADETTAPSLTGKKNIAMWFWATLRSFPKGWLALEEQPSLG